MSTSEVLISLADLSAAGIRLQPSQAAAITSEVIRLTRQNLLPGIPAANALRLRPDGSLDAEGDVDDGNRVERAGRLLDAMLPSFDAPPEFRAPGALRIVVARALRTLDLPPYRSLAEFEQALERFAAGGDAASVARSLYESWATSAWAHAATVSIPPAHVSEQHDSSGRLTI